MSKSVHVFHANVQKSLKYTRARVIDDEFEFSKHLGVAVSDIDITNETPMITDSYRLIEPIKHIINKTKCSSRK